MKRIAVLTSGGDAPGMNAAILQLFVKQFQKEWKFSVSMMDMREWLLVKFSPLTPHLLEILFPVVVPSFIQLVTLNSHNAKVN